MFKLKIGEAINFAILANIAVAAGTKAANALTCMMETSKPAAKRKRSVKKATK